MEIEDDLGNGQSAQTLPGPAELTTSGLNLERGNRTH